MKLRLKHFSKRKPCYYCGAPAPSTQEHAPPKFMFAGFDCDSITVPSCVEHNNEKGHRDRAIGTWLLKSLARAIDPDLPAKALPSDVVKAIELLSPHFAQAKREVQDRPLLTNEELSFDIPALNFSVYDWIRQLSAALVWSVTGEFDDSIQWKEALVWNALYLQGTERKNLVDLLFEVAMNEISERNIENFDWKAGWSAYPRSYPPDIYNFGICFSPTLITNIELEVAFRHQFYGCLNWYIWFTPSQRTKTTLETAIVQLNTAH